MIKSVSATNPRGETLEMILTQPERSGIIIESIDGLGTGMMDISSATLSNADGSMRSSIRMPDRQVILTLILLEDPLIEDTRHKLYKYFPPKKEITLSIKTDRRTVYCKGVVESHEPNIFSEKETDVISILCNDPYLYDAGGTEISFSGAQPNFEFPFENPSLDEDAIEISMLRLDTRVIFNYTGDLDAGILISIQSRGPTGPITIYNAGTYESMVVDVNLLTQLTGLQFSSGDIIEISTFSGNKYARLLRNGIYTNVISIINKEADWFKVSPGENWFAFAAEDYPGQPEGSGEKNLLLNFSYRNAYGGV